MGKISLELNGWEPFFILEDGEPKSSLTPNLRVVGFIDYPPDYLETSDFDPVLDELMPLLQRFPMLHAIAIIFGSYEELSLAMSPYRPSPFHPLILNHKYILVIRRHSDGDWGFELDFPEVAPLPPKGKQDYIGIHPITLLPTGMYLRNTSDHVFLISYYMYRSDLEQRRGHYPVVARNSRPLNIMLIFFSTKDTQV